ncbi:MAG TPA: dihydropteroate synthase [Oligoflexia bacterium]|nr:dihydropteroate synthase [Oligoflexia bacterium]HMP49639.1 dihydropteroate synthase [Oligoflexia bacterium]
MRKIFSENLSQKIMGILNLSPESFSDGGNNRSPEDEVIRFNYLLDSGADLIDVGAQASGPGSVLLDEEVEAMRVRNFLDVLVLMKGKESLKCVSVDTFRSSVAALSIERGVGIINDISALRADKNLGSIIAESGVEVVLMYSKENAGFPLVSDQETVVGPLFSVISRFFEERIEYALSIGISGENIILDTGFGAFISSFPEKSWEIIDNFHLFLDKFSNFRFLTGVSRKSFLGGSLSDRDIHSKLVEMHLLHLGASIIRTHNVELLRQLLPTWYKLGYAPISARYL